MTLVWDKYRGAGSEFLAMLALADWCSDGGGSLHPSIAALAEKMGVSESQARRTLHKLIDDGFVSVVGRANGGRPGATRQYRIDVAGLSAEPVNPVPVSPETEVSTTGMDATPSVGATSRMAGAPDMILFAGETAQRRDRGAISVLVRSSVVPVHGSAPRFAKDVLRGDRGAC